MLNCTKTTKEMHKMCGFNISKIMKEACPGIKIGRIKARVKVCHSSLSLNDEINQLIENTKRELVIGDISKISTIASGRKAYKKFGKDPARYRLSCESLLRRILKNQDLYRVNNVVDIGNMVSIRERLVVCVYDAGLIDGDISFHVNMEDVDYCGIGRGKLNIKGIPSFNDKAGAFGTTTSDSERTKVSDLSEDIEFFIVDFDGGSDMKELMEDACRDLEVHAGAKIIDKEINR